MQDIEGSALRWELGGLRCGVEEFEHLSIAFSRPGAMAALVKENDENKERQRKEIEIEALLHSSVIKYN